MIVVAIIGILAAIAIPQFAAYRMRGFNSSALSDTKNLATSEAALFADWQRFGVTAIEAGAAFDPAAAPAPAADVLAVGGDDDGDGLVCTDANGTDRGVIIPLGSGVTAVAHVDNLATATTFTAGAKHLQGDTTFAIDADSTAVYQDPLLVAVGTALTADNITDPVADADEFLNQGGWVIK